MIKLGVFDLDGTLLDDDGKLPGTFYADLETLSQRGVQAAIASARPVQFLFDMFDRDIKLLISGEDGNVFFRGRELLGARYLNPSLIERIRERIAPRQDMAAIFSGLEQLYVFSGDYERLARWGLGQFLPKAPLALSGRENICKIHLYCRGGVPMAREMIAGVFSDLKDECDMLEGGYGWIGFMEKDSNKASAVRFFQKHLKLSSDEIAVFGDSENDTPMFELTRYSFAMKNADRLVQKKAAFITEEDNNHNGAMKALLKLSLGRSQ